MLELPLVIGLYFLAVAPFAMHPLLSFISIGTIDGAWLGARLHTADDPQAQLALRAIGLAATAFMVRLAWGDAE